VTLLPWVEDIAEFYGRIAVSVVPLLQGTGVSLKTLESLRYGRPVVSTPAGARGLDVAALPGVHLAETAAGFAGTVCDLLDRAAVRPDPRRAVQAHDAMAAFQSMLHTVITEAQRDRAGRGIAREATGIGERPA
jgi:glycosyltransferase involved in cell wall biosynthesis